MSNPQSIVEQPTGRRDAPARRDDCARRVGPNFFIIGAPKCGTTALAHYLGQHPNVFFCVPKEPFYFSTDYPGLRRMNRVETLDDYLKLFDRAGAEHTAVGEGSTNYFSSATAVPNILEFNPEARFLALLRNPVEVAHAFHGELVYSFNEDVRAFEPAWRLQQTRRQGRGIPPSCRARQFLQYAEVAAYARPLQRLFDLVPAHQRKVIVYDDFADDTAGVYRDVLDFLGLPDDRRDEFPRVFESRVHRVEWLARFLIAPPSMLAGPIQRIRQHYRRRETGPIAAVKRFLRIKRPRQTLRPSFVRELEDHFRPEVRQLSDLLNRDLTHWTDST